MGTRPGSHMLEPVHEALHYIPLTLPSSGSTHVTLNHYWLEHSLAWQDFPGVHVGEALANNPAGSALGLATPLTGHQELLPTRMLRCWATTVLGLT